MGGALATGREIHSGVCSAPTGPSAPLTLWVTLRPGALLGRRKPCCSPGGVGGGRGAAPTAALSQALAEQVWGPESPLSCANTWGSSACGWCNGSHSIPRAWPSAPRAPGLSGASHAVPTGYCEAVCGVAWAPCLARSSTGTGCPCTPPGPWALLGSPEGTVPSPCEIRATTLPATDPDPTSSAASVLWGRAGVR